MRAGRWQNSTAIGRKPLVSIHLLIGYNTACDSHELTLGIAMNKPALTGVTKKHEAEPSLFPGELSLFHAITEHIPDAAVFVVDQDFRYVHAGGSGLRTAGMKPEDFEGKFLANVVPNELLNQYLSDYTAIFSGETFIREHTVGSRSYRTRGRLIKGANGGRDFALAVSYDITDEAKVAALRHIDQ